jgi:hypothetical protein
MSFRILQNHCEKSLPSPPRVEVRHREKTFRSVKTDISILNGYRLYCNFIRPHEALHGMTPADFAGIHVQGENKWLTPIQNASKKS